MTVAIILLRRKLLQLPLVAVVIVVIHPVIHDRSDPFATLAVGDKVSDLILHVTEETLLRRIVPTVALSGHGLDEGGIPKFLDEGVAGVVATLITMNDRLIIQFRAVPSAQFVNRTEDELNPEIIAELVRKHFMGADVKDRG